MPQHTPPAIASTEPTAAEYAEFGRYAAALLGASAEWDDPAAYLEELAQAASARGVQGIGTGTPDDLAEWRAVADLLGVEHDGEPGDADECTECGEDLNPGHLAPMCDECYAEATA